MEHADIMTMLCMGVKTAKKWAVYVNNNLAAEDLRD